MQQKVLTPNDFPDLVTLERRLLEFQSHYEQITKPFKLGGTLASPSLDIDVTETAKTVGTVLLGPAGIAYLLVSGSSGKESACAAALKAAGRGTPDTKAKSGEEKGPQTGHN